MSLLCGLFPLLFGLHLKYIILETVTVVIEIVFSLKNYTLLQMLNSESSIFRQGLGDTNVGMQCSSCLSSLVFLERNFRNQKTI